MTTPNETHPEAPPMGRDPMAELQERLRSALAANERDRSAYARFCESLRQWVRRWSWLTEGRGPYEWDDDRWHEEFGCAQREIKTIANRLEKNAHATDLRDCPTTQAEVEAARAAVPLASDPMGRQSDRAPNGQWPRAEAWAVMRRPYTSPVFVVFSEDDAVHYQNEYQRRDATDGRPTAEVVHLVELREGERIVSDSAVSSPAPAEGAAAEGCVSRKGYDHDPETGALRLHNMDLVFDPAARIDPDRFTGRVRVIPLGNPPSPAGSGPPQTERQNDER